MIPDMRLKNEWWNEASLEKKPIRDGYGDCLVELGRENKDIVALSADLTESTRTHHFALELPNRFFQVGIAEQNMMGIGAGLALNGKIPFVASYAVFSPGRNWDQFRVSVCYSKANVKVIGGHAGLSVGPDGATHQALEDIAITRVLPNLTVIVPCDYEQAKKATRDAAYMNGPVYIRVGRDKTPVFTTSDSPFEIGKAQVLYSGDDVTIIASGLMVHKAMLAAKELSEEGISCEVLNLHTVKPIDIDGIIASVSKTGCAVTAEEHQVNGGVGSAVSEVLVKQRPVPLEMVGVMDTFAESGETAELFEKYGLTVNKIKDAARRVIERKKNSKKS